MCRQPFLAVLLVLPALAACGDTVCNMHTVAALQAGAGARDCGHVPLGQDRTSADACTVEEFKAGRRFFASFDLQGTDSSPRMALVGTEPNKASVLFSDDYVRPQHVTKSVCGDPTVSTSGAARVECTQITGNEPVCGPVPHGG